MPEDLLGPRRGVLVHGRNPRTGLETPPPGGATRRRRSRADTRGAFGEPGTGPTKPDGSSRSRPSDEGHAPSTNRSIGPPDAPSREAEGGIGSRDRRPNPRCSERSTARPRRAQLVQYRSRRRQTASAVRHRTPAWRLGDPTGPPTSRTVDFARGLARPVASPRGSGYLSRFPLIPTRRFRHALPPQEQPHQEGPQGRLPSPHADEQGSPDHQPPPPSRPPRGDHELTGSRPAPRDCGEQAFTSPADLGSAGLSLRETPSRPCPASSP